MTDAMDLLSVEHTILERPFMEFRPFGADERGVKIRDVSGVSVRAMVNYVQLCVARRDGEEAGEQAARELCRLLNERIRDPVYHVTPAFLKNTWHSYSYEFVCYVYEFSRQLSGDADFEFNAGKEKISPIIEILGRPFTVGQIYRMLPHFGRKYAEGSIEFGVGTVTNQSAILRIKFTDRVYRQFGPYRKRCAAMVCRSFHGSFAAVPERVHHLPPATVTDRTCMAKGDEWCEWEVRWSALGRRWLPAWGRREKTEAWSRKLPFASRESVAAAAPDLGPAKGAATGTERSDELLSKEHTILERPFMEFRQFGVDERGERIRDSSGVVVQSNVEYLEEVVRRKEGADAAARVAQKLCDLLNERIRDPAYHVTPLFLRNDWHSYSYEFVAYLREFCKLLSNDPKFQFNLGEDKIVSPVIQILGRPFSLQQIYGMYPYFAQKYARGVCEFGVGEVTDRSAVVRLRFTERALRQLGPYLKACAENVCDQSKAGLSVVPEKVHGLPRATVRDRLCIVHGDDWCEWEFTWDPRTEGRRWRLWGAHARSRPAIDDIQAKTLAHGSPAKRVDTTHVSKGVPESLLSEEHTILERPMMLYRPFGVNERGEKIRDISGAIVKANVDQLKETVGRASGSEAGERAVEELCRLLNERMPDFEYHVTPAFLGQVWNSYSYEFVCYLRTFAERLSGDPEFHFHVGQGQHLSPLIQILGRPFPMPTIYKMWPHFAEKFAKGSIICEMGLVTDRSAIMRLKFTEKTYEQFGGYRTACARMTCEATKGAFTMVPVRVHRLPPAAVKDRTCIVKGDEWCEWEVTWQPQARRHVWWPVFGLVTGAAVLGYLRLFHPALTFVEACAVALIPAMVAWFETRRRLQRQAKAREALIQEQVQFVEDRHEELREAYLEQEQTRVELRRKIGQLTTLHRAGLLFSSTLRPETLLQNVLETIVRDLHYDRAMFAFFDPVRRVSHSFHIRGASKEVADFVRTLEVPVTDASTLEGTVLLKGEPILVGDLREEWDRLHPLKQQLVSMLGVKSVISVPLKANDQILGSLTVHCAQEHSLTSDDLELMMTLAGQVAIALDNTEAYRQVETLNVGLEGRVRERTAELEAANTQLKEIDRLKSQFLAHVSHELRTPLTSITGFTDNMLEGLAGQLTDKQQVYLTRMKANGGRLARMIANLLDLSRIEAGKLELSLEEVTLGSLVSDVIEQIRPIAVAKHQRLQSTCDEDLVVWADADRLSQILTNLIDNAIKYTPDGGSATVTVARESAHVATVSVADTGPGIPRDALPKLFDPFFRVSHHVKSQIKGLGLGLSIVKELVELHGGTIVVRSEEGRGTEFRFTIPMQRRLDRKAGPVPSSSKRILIVDDDPDIRQLLRDRLESDGYVVQMAASGREALSVVDSVILDGAILDIGLPEVDGLEVLRQIRRDHPLLPVIMITAVKAREHALLAMESGAQAYLLKPFDPAQLHLIVDRWFGPREQ